MKYVFFYFCKNKEFIIFNILGLLFGMVSCFFVVLYCWYEFNYDGFYLEVDYIYCIEYSMDGFLGEKRGCIFFVVGLVL